MSKLVNWNLKFRSSVRLILIFLIFPGLWSCKKDPEETDSVKIETLGVTDVTANGATFEALVSISGNPNISEHGFLWAENRPDWETKAQRISFKGKPSEGLVSIVMERDLIVGTTYVVAAYVVLDGVLVMENFVLFVSQGSKGPQIIDFTPKNIYWGDTITIHGKYFGDAKIQVRIGEVATPLIYISDSLLKVTVSDIPLKRVSNLKVSVQGNISVAKDSLYLIHPEITSSTPITVRFGDTVTVQGTGFHPTGRFTKVFVKDAVAPLLESDSSYLKFIIPHQIRGRYHDLTIQSSGHILQSKNIIEIAQPVINSIHTENGLIPGKKITLSGENFHPQKEFNVLRFDNLTASIISASYHEIVAIIPDGIVSERHTSEYRDVILLLDAGGNMGQAKAELNWKSYFTRKKDFPGPFLDRGAFFAINKDLYFGLGYEPQEYGNPVYSLDFWRYQTESDEWKKLSRFPGYMSHDPVSFVFNNQGYVGLGGSPISPPTPYNNGFYAFDPQTETWTFASVFPGGPSFGAFSFVIGDYVWMGTGYNLSSQTNWWDNTNAVWRYSTQSGHWEQQPDFPELSWGAKGVTIENSAFVFTQNNGIFKFDGNSFSQFYPFNNLIRDAVVFFGIKDKLYLGIIKDVSTSQYWGREIYELDPQSGNITRVFHFPRSTDPYGIQVSVVNGKAYFVGGPDRHTWEFDPSVELP